MINKLCSTCLKHSNGTSAKFSRLTKAFFGGGATYYVKIQWNMVFKSFLSNLVSSMDLKGLDLKIGSLTLRQLKAATNNFDVANKIGESGFGSAYKGFLLDETIISIKQLSSKSKQGNHEFPNEIGMISALQHPHVAKFNGCCVEGNQLLLVYEYMENNSLACALFAKLQSFMQLLCILEPRRVPVETALGNKALELKEKGKLMELVDPKLGLDFIEKEVIVMINITILCTNVTPTIRPTMSSVVSMLEGRAVVEELVPDSTIFNHKMAVKGMMVNLQHRHEIDMNDSFLKCR
ncbi:hypothetical protein HYC85_011274 [Camellia sinensis]|uniref:Protein kinase domain-containing protein n=1 Tax=Camellia sinensis TaxID=4442 RepID=A0A7J7HAK9_CAMSI|nr:hypothetical protein HYC85_011274 [Camellia sinensis]